MLSPLITLLGTDGKLHITALFNCERKENMKPVDAAQT